AAIGALGYASDLTKDVLDPLIVAFLKHEGRHTETSELAGFGDQLVLVFLKSIADEDQRAHLEQLGFLLGVDEDLAQLRVSDPAHETGHDLGKVPGIAGPARGRALILAAIIDQLNIESAGGSNLTEHLSLQVAGRIPGRLPARRSVEVRARLPAKKL